jgi:glycosyltransferase involved in cell wall biosynthesis
MRVLFFTGNIEDPGGTERVCSILASALSDTGRYQVGIVSLYQGKRPFFSVSPSIRLYSLFAENRRFKFIYPLVVYRLRRVLADYQPDILVDVESMACLFSLLAVRGCRAKHVVWEHFNIGIDLGVKSRRLARALAVRWADVVVTLTERDAVQWRERFRPAVPIIAIPNPSPYPFSVQSAYPQNSRTVLAAGHLIHRKGFDLLIRAWNEIPAGVRDGWRLRIVGAGEEEQSLKDLVASLPIACTVDFPGRNRDMAKEYRSAGLFVLSSRKEGLPMVLLEAMAFALPVVAFDCENGPAEIVVYGKTGLLVPPEDIDTLAEAIGRMLSDPSFRAECARHALERVNDFAIDRVVEQWMALFDDLTADKPGHRCKNRLGTARDTGR